MIGADEELTPYGKLLGSISFNMRFEMMKRDLKVMHIFHKAGITYVHFAGIVSGDRTPSIEAVCNIAEAIGCEVFDLLKPISLN